MQNTFYVILNHDLAVGYKIYIYQALTRFSLFFTLLLWNQLYWIISFPPSYSSSIIRGIPIEAILNLLSYFSISTPPLSFLHITLYAPCALTLKRKANWMSQTTIILPGAVITAPPFLTANLFISLFLTSVHQFQETVLSLAQRLIPLPTPSFSMCLSSLLSLFYWVQSAPSMFERFSILIVTTIFVQKIFLPELLHEKTIEFQIA